VDQVHVIRHKVLVEERTIRSVARELRVSRNTIRRYLREPGPVRKPGPPKGRPVSGAVEPRIQALLDEWAQRTTPKQRITGSRVHQELVGQGVRVGVTTVREVLREIRRRRAEVFVPLVHRPGDEAQVDFFEVVVEVEGLRRKAWKFLMRLMYSGRDFAWLYDRCDQVAYLDGHVRAFAHFGAVPHRCVYDNLAPAVRKVVFPRRELTARFQALVAHYLFEPCFARPGQGHDKGGVEARGKGIRLQHLVPVPRGDSLGTLSQQLLADLDRQAESRRDREGRSVLERFAEERPRLLPLPEAAFDARKLVPCTVSRQALVKVEGALYSVPSRWKQLEATAYVGPDEVEIVCRGERQRCARQRFGGKDVRYRHYLPELARKPQALRQVAPELLAELGEPFAGLWRLLVDRHGPADAARVFARILEAVDAHGEAAVAEAVAAALAAGTLRTLPLRRPAPTVAAVVVPEALRAVVVEATPAAAFDALLGEASHE
jgi:transposase